MPFRVMQRPYQPSLLCLLLGATALVVPLAWLTGLVVYSADEGRLGRLPFSLPGEWIDIHGTVGVLLWPIALLALVLAVGSGKLKEEGWLRNGQFDHLVDSVHLLALLLVAFSVVLHVAAVLLRGGLPLARSMASVALRPGDLPRSWFDQVRRSFTVRS